MEFLVGFKTEIGSYPVGAAINTSDTSKGELQLFYTIF